MSIILERLTKSYGRQIIVDDVSLQIDDGELFVLLGASGSGKSTILRMIAGLLPVDEGSIHLHGNDVTDAPPQDRNVGFVFQNYSLFRHMTVAGNIEFGLAVRNVPQAARATKRNELLELIGLAGLGNRFPRQLSGGQQQRVAVARALAFEPSVLLLDEPFGALDVKIRSQLRETLKALQRHTGVTTILVTHDQEEAFELADRIGVIDRGRLLEVGAPATLYREPKHEFVAQFLGQAVLLAGRLTNDAVTIGSLALPFPRPETGTLEPGESDILVLLRPEGITLAATQEELGCPTLGAGTVEAVHFLGAMQRVQIRLDPAPGLRELGADYGEEGVDLQVARMMGADGLPAAVGDRLWVGIRSFHVLPRAELEIHLCLDESCDAAYIAGLARVLRRVHDAAPTVLVVAEREASVARVTRVARRLLGGLRGAPVFRTRIGAPAEEFLREAAARPYGLVVINGGDEDGNERRAEAMENVARRCPASVLVVKGRRRQSTRLLLCTAGGAPGKLDVLVGGRVARRLGASATLLYVASPGLRPDTLTGGPVARHLEQGVLTLVTGGVQATAKVRTGSAADEILAEAAEGDHDIIVVGGHLASTQMPFREQDLAGLIVHRADRPVLIVRGRIA